MKILLIHQAFVLPKEAGGTRHYEFAKRCVQQGHSFNIIASDINYLSGQRLQGCTGVITEQEVEGIRILRAYTHPVLHRSFVWRVLSFLSFMVTSFLAAWRTGPVDLVMGTSPPIFQAVSAWLIASLRHRPFLLEIRDLWPDFAIDMGVLTNPVLITLSRWLEHFLYERATHLLVNSPAYRDYLLSRGVSADKISLIPNGVDVKMFNDTPKGESVRNAFGLNGWFVIAYTGALGLANDIPTILRAARYLREEKCIHFLLVGDGKERVSLEALAQEWGLTNVTFAGAYPKSEMRNFLAASDVCVATLQDIPMFRTTYPNKVFDYMAAGRPTIIAIDGVIREVIEAARGGIFVPPGDAIAMAEAIQKLVNNPSQAREMGRAARNYVTTHFNREEQAASFIDLVSHLVG